MNPLSLTSLRWLAIQLFFAMTFGLAAWLKWSQGVPEWFVKQFQPTWLAHAPGGLASTFYFLAALESAAFLGCVASILSGEFFRKNKTILRGTLTFSLFVFLVLAYGSRLTAKYDIAAYNLLYFLVALVCLAWAGGETSPAAM